MKTHSPRTRLPMLPARWPIHYSHNLRASWWPAEVSWYRPWGLAAYPWGRPAWKPSHRDSPDRWDPWGHRPSGLQARSERGERPSPSSDLHRVSKHCQGHRLWSWAQVHLAMKQELVHRIVNSLNRRLQKLDSLCVKYKTSCYKNVQSFKMFTYTYLSTMIGFVRCYDRSNTHTTCVGFLTVGVYFQSRFASACFNVICCLFIQLIISVQYRNV